MSISKRVLLFGASVTQQGYESGYSTHLQKSASLSYVRQFGVGGCHFNDAGYYLLEEALCDDHFDICILDWNSTWLSRFDEVKLASVAIRLVRRRIIPLFVILPTKLNRETREAESLVQAFCDKWSIPCMDLRPGFDHEAMLRDDFHTNELGASCLANAILDMLTRIDVGSTLRNAMAAMHSLPSVPVIGEIKVGKSLLQNEVLRIEMDQITPEHAVDLTIDMMVGPFSSYMDIHHDGSKVATFQIWDMWCHYERRKLFQIIDIPSHVPIPKVVEISLKTGAIDYSVCRQPDFKYNGLCQLNIAKVLASNLHVNV